MFCKEFKIDITLADDIVLDFPLFKKTEIAGQSLMALITVLMVLPVSSADCKQGFSQMNLHHRKKQATNKNSEQINDGRHQ